MPTMTKALALDCEMVAAGNASMLARVSLVNEHGEEVYDTYVKPTQNVTDYRYAVSGITLDKLRGGKSFDVVKNDVIRLLQGRVLVGHDLDFDLKALGISHPDYNIRDTAKCNIFKSAQNQKRSLKDLAREYLGIIIQQGTHDSLEDARAAMKLFKLYESRWS